MAETPTKGLDARAAELLARHFNTAFTTVSGYGTDHPMSSRSGESLMEALTAAFEHESAITLLLDRGALFVEKHPVGERFNPRRLLNLLAQTKIESFTFDKAIRLEDLQNLFDILAHQDMYPDADAIEAELQKRECRGLRMNYVTYKKVTADQKVVSEDAEGGLAIQIDRPGGSEFDTFGSMASMMSVTELLKDPAAYAERLNSSDEDKDERQKVVRQLRHLIAQIESGEIKTEGALSSTELLQAVNSLREKVRRHHSSSRDVERLLGEDNQVLGEVDQLTYSTLVSLVREEYRSGNFSARRMAQIINRMLPDSRDLRRLMPQLKQGLLGEGMSVAEYGKLVHELSGEVRGDHVVRALEEGAESVGLDVDDIVDQIREDPSEAARLIVMSTELRRSGVDDSEQLSSAFTEYIERISERLALDLPQKHRDGSDATRAQLERVRKFLIDQLSRQGLDKELTLELRRKAEAQSDPEAIRIAQAAAAEVSKESAGPSAPPAAEKDTEESAGEEPGTPEAPLRPKLSHRVLNPANTAFFLKREIKSAQRYRTHFSVIKISIERLREPAGPSRVPEREELIDFLPVLYEGLIAQLRDLDLIGSLDRTLQAVPLLILPMTDEAGANVVRWRLTDYLRDRIFDVDEEKMGVIATLTAASFDPGSDEEGRAFIQRIQTQHERNRAALAG